ncbi:hypothetical protein VCRLGP8_990025 [Vibrio crassostreae]|nr:hypothetical protein VCRLGP8_990025 [Vibrio crassostreae]
MTHRFEPFTVLMESMIMVRSAGTFVRNERIVIKVRSPQRAPRGES